MAKASGRNALDQGQQLQGSASSCKRVTCRNVLFCRESRDRAAVHAQVPGANLAELP
jgi:hypothetical protein